METRGPNTSCSQVSSKDLDYVSDARAAFLEERAPLSNLLMSAIIGFTVAFVLWAHYSKIDEITRGFGKVIPSDSLQIVQSLDGGVLSELLITEGDTVMEGQTLARISDIALAAGLEASISRRDTLLASIARLEAEADSKTSVSFPSHLEETKPELVKSERRLFEMRLLNLNTTLKALTKSLKFRKSELEITLPLAEEGVVSQVEALRLQTQINDLQGEIDRAKTSYLQDVHTELSKSRNELARTEQEIRLHQEKLEKTVVVSPAQGIINKIHFKTLGGVVRPSEPMIEIVPSENELIVEANISPSDIGFIHIGQPVTVKLTAYDFSIFGGLKGSVEQISADTFRNDNGESFYRIQIRTRGRTLATNNEELPIMPGMNAQVDVLTGKKTILQYLFKPLLRVKENALRER